MIVNARIDGIPCQVRLAYQPPIHGARERGTGFQLEPDEPEVFVIEAVLDRRGKPAPWLGRKMTPQDEDRICQESHDDMRGAREDEAYERYKEATL